MYEIISKLRENTHSNARTIEHNVCMSAFNAQIIIQIRLKRGIKFSDMNRY